MYKYHEEKTLLNDLIFIIKTIPIVGVLNYSLSSRRS